MRKLDHIAWRVGAVLIPVLLIAAYSPTAEAHVKWFAAFSFGDKPASVQDIITPTAIALALLSAVVIALLVPIDLRLAEQVWYQRINRWLESFSENSVLIMRVGTGAVMLMVWQANAMLAPELPILSSWIGWFQFVIALLLLFRATTPLAGVGVLFLYGIAAVQFGLFHMLDYVYYIGIAIYLMVCNASNPRIRGLGLPALYATVGFSLCWVALEKLVYPEWGLYILSTNPQLTLGLDPQFFLTAAAFVELSLGYLLIICLLQRPLSLVITLVFFSTTTLFGKTEVIGHTLLHAALIVFVIEGPGRIYQAPITFHRRLPLRIAFAAVNFILLVAILIFPYTAIAYAQYEAFVAAQPTANDHELGDAAAALQLDFVLHPAVGGGTNLELLTENFDLRPPESAAPESLAGYALLSINGEEVGRLYGTWYYLPPLRTGSYQIMVMLVGQDGGVYTVNGAPITAVQTLAVP